MKLAGEAGAIIAQNCSEGHFIVTMSFTQAPAAHLAPEEEIML